MNVLEGYIDQRKIDEYVLNVGVYPLFNAMTEALKIPFLWMNNVVPLIVGFC